jgi:hypothetical protein
VYDQCNRTLNDVALHLMMNPYHNSFSFLITPNSLFLTISSKPAYLMNYANCFRLFYLHGEHECQAPHLDLYYYCPQRQIFGRCKDCKKAQYAFKYLVYRQITGGTNLNCLLKPRQYAAIIKHLCSFPATQLL